MANELQDYYTHEAARDMDYRKFMEMQTSSIGASVEQSSARIKESVDMQTLATVASHAAIDQTLQKGFVGMGEIVAAGHSNILRQLGNMSATFNSGLSRISADINLMSNNICNKLDAIHNAIKNPLYTEARELSSRAADRYSKGLFKEALEDVNAAIKKDTADYFSWFLKGALHAYGVGEFNGEVINVIDLREAITAFKQAAGYNHPYIKKSEDARCFEAEIYFYLGKAQHSYANELLRTGDFADAGEMISEALGSFEQSVQYSDKMLESMYNVARCNVLLNKKEAAIGDLERLILLDPKYCIKVLEDGDFLGILTNFTTLIERLRHNLFVGEAEKNYKKVVDLQNTLNTHGAVYENRNRIPPCFSESLPYLDILGYNDEFKMMIPQLESAIDRERKRIARVEEEKLAMIARAEEEKLERKREKRERALEEQRRIAKAEEDKRKARLSKIGTICFALIGVIVFLLPIIAVACSRLITGGSEADNTVFVITLIIAAIILAISGAAGAGSGCDTGTGVGCGYLVIMSIIGVILKAVLK